MNKAKKITGVIVALLILIGIGTGGYFYYDATHYYKTNNASVSANMVTISPLVSGNILNWNVKEGDKVKKGQVLGNQDVVTQVSSSDLNPAGLKSTADSILSKAEIVSPLDGSIVQSNIVIGQTVAPGTTVAIVADTSNMFIKANIEETNISKIKTGQRVSISIDAYPRKKFTGSVVMVGQATQSAFSQSISLNTSGTYSKVKQLIPVRISIINEENLSLMIGMNATINVSLTNQASF